MRRFDSCQGRQFSEQLHTATRAGADLAQNFVHTDDSAFFDTHMRGGTDRHTEQTFSESDLRYGAGTDAVGKPSMFDEA